MRQDTLIKYAEQTVSLVEAYFTALDNERKQLEKEAGVIRNNKGEK